MKKIVFTSIVLGFLSFVAACSSDDTDTQKPTVQILTPANESNFAIGDDISISFLLTDNQALKSFKVDLHEDDGHTHSGRSAAETPMQYELIENIDGNPKTFSKTIVVTIPANTKLTEYHLGVFAIDIAGNEEKSYINFHIE